MAAANLSRLQNDRPCFWASHTRAPCHFKRVSRLYALCAHTVILRGKPTFQMYDQKYCTAFIDEIIAFDVYGNAIRYKMHKSDYTIWITLSSLDRGLYGYRLAKVTLFITDQLDRNRS